MGETVGNKVVGLEVPKEVEVVMMVLPDVVVAPVLPDVVVPVVVWMVVDEPDEVLLVVVLDTPSSLYSDPQ